MLQVYWGQQFKQLRFKDIDAHCRSVFYPTYPIHFRAVAVSIVDLCPYLHLILTHCLISHGAIIMWLTEQFYKGNGNACLFILYRVVLSANFVGSIKRPIYDFCQFKLRMRKKKIQNFSAFVVFIIKYREGLMKIIIETN